MLTRRLYALSVGVCIALVPVHGAWILGAGGVPGFAVVIGAALGAVAADWISGAVHWACDTWGSAHTPWVGRGLIQSFREHHRDPRAMLGHDWIDRNGQAAIPAALCLLGMALPAGRSLLEVSLPLHACLASACLFGAFSNQVHAWAHMPRPPAPVRWLQRGGVILSPSRHARHHAGRHSTGYCIATGWSNPLLDRIGFWRSLERGISALTGARPRGRYGSPAGRTI